jgi:hypothetical protein
LNDHAPDGYYFGNNDNSDFGLWELEGMAKGGAVKDSGINWIITGYSI